MSIANSVHVEYKPRQIHTIFLGLILIMLLGTIDQAIVAPALSPIGAEFRDLGNVTWVVTAYFLTSTASTPIAGRLSDIYGRRSIVLAALSIFLIGSIICGTAHSLVMLIVGRGVQGMGGGALMVLPNTIVADILSPRERGKYQVYISGTYGVSSLAGPILGGILSEQFSWRLIFLINIPLASAAILLSWITLKDLNIRRLDCKVDYVGSILMALATMSLLVAMSWGGHRYAWISTDEFKIFGCFIVMICIFFWWQRRSVSPLLPLSILGSPLIVVTSIAAVLISMVNIALSVFLPLYLQWGRGLSVQMSGFLLTAPLFGVVLGSYFSGQYMRFTGKYKLSPLAGLLMAASSLFWLSLDAVDTTLMAFFAITFFIGLGIGLSLPPMMVSSQNSVPATDIGIATAIHTFFRAVGGSVGVALFSTIVFGVLGGTSTGLGASASSDAVVGTIGGLGADRAFIIFFDTSAGVIGLAWLVLLALPTIPFRSSSARLERLAEPAGRDIEQTGTQT